MSYNRGILIKGHEELWFLLRNIQNVSRRQTRANYIGEFFFRSIFSQRIGDVGTNGRTNEKPAGIDFTIN